MQADPNAAFVRFALRHGVMSLRTAKEWAYGVIDADPQPPLDIIDGAARIVAELTPAIRGRCTSSVKPGRSSRSARANCW